MSKLTTSRHWDKSWNKTQRHDIDTNIDSEELFQYLQDKKYRNIIELGCGGSGSSLYFFHKKLNYDLYGVDTSIDGLNYLRDNLKKEGIPVKVWKEDILSDDFSKRYNSSFDISFSSGLIEHFTDKDLLKVVKTHFDIIRDNGITIISVPNGVILRKIIGLIFSPFDTYQRHNLKICKIEAVKKLLKHWGKIEYLDYYGGKFSSCVSGFKKINNIFELINKLDVDKHKSLFYPSIIFITKKERNR